MPMRKSTVKKSRRRPYRKMRRSLNKSLVPRTRFSSDIHFFKRLTNTPTIVGVATASPYVDIFRFSLAQLTNVSEYTALFDRYMITKVVTKLFLKIDPSAQTAAVASYPRLFYVRDVDDSGTPSSIDELRQHSNCKVKVMNPNYPVTLVCRPNILHVAYSSLTVSNYTPKWKQWLDLGDINTPHYAWKYAIDDLTNTNYRVTCEHMFYFKCKESR